MQMTVFHALLPIFTEYGYSAVFLSLMLCGFGVPFPEDIILVAGGVIAGLGYANEHAMFAVALAGVLLGDGVTFVLGRHYGERLLNNRLISRLLSPERVALAHEKFATHGAWVMFVARFLPGLRTPVYFAAGMTRRVSFGTWLLMDGMAALLSVPLWVYLGFFGARNFDDLFVNVQRSQAVVLTLLGMGLLLAVAIWWWRRRASKSV
jgi:membrane protein DedA with SNARE-associated domain